MKPSLLSYYIKVKPVSRLMHEIFKWENVFSLF